MTIHINTLIWGKKTRTFGYFWEYFQTMEKDKNMKKESLILGRILKKIAPKIGATVVMEPEWEIVGQITFKNGKHSYFRYNTLDLNPVGSSDTIPN